MKQENNKLPQIPLPRIKQRLDLAQVMPFVILRGIDEGVESHDPFPVGTIERMGDKRTAHVVAIDLPITAHLGKVVSLILQILDGRINYRACNHIGIVEHSWNIVLKKLISLGHKRLFGERVLPGWILIDKHALVALKRKAPILKESSTPFK